MVESSEANLRWAGNSLTTNGAMRSRQVVVVSFVDGGSGMAAGTVSRTGTPDIAALVAASEQAARDAGPAEDAVPLVGEKPAGSGDWDADPASTSIEVFAEFAPALGQAFGEARDRGELLFGFAEHQMETTYLGSSTGAAAAARPAHRPGRAQRQEPRLLPLGVGRHRHPRLPRRVRPDLAADVARKMAWSQRRVELPAGRYETLLPPSAVSDLMIYLYWTMEARDADEGRNVFAKPGGGNRVGERLANLPLTLRSDPSAPGLEAAPFQVVGASSGTASVFDNGMATPAVDWISEGTLTNLIRPRAWALKTTAPATAAVDNLILEDPTATATLEEMLAVDRPRPAADDALVHPRGGPADAAAHRPHPRRRLPGRGRRGDGRGEQLPVQRVAGRPAGPRGPGEPTERTLPREWNDWFTRTAMPALRVPDFNMSSVSPAS